MTDTAASREQRGGRRLWARQVVTSTFGGVVWGMVMATVYRIIDGEPWLPNVVIFGALGVLIVAPVNVWVRSGWSGRGSGVCGATSTSTAGR